MAAPLGNKNAVRSRDWFNALRKECVQRDALDKLAKLVVDKALEGERWAVEEVTTRFDGKPAQAVELSGPDGGPVESVNGFRLAPLE